LGTADRWKRVPVCGQAPAVQVKASPVALWAVPMPPSGVPARPALVCDPQSAVPATGLVARHRRLAQASRPAHTPGVATAALARARAPVRVTGGDRGGAHRRLGRSLRAYLAAFHARLGSQWSGRASRCYHRGLIRVRRLAAAHRSIDQRNRDNQESAIPGGAGDCRFLIIPMGERRSPFHERVARAISLNSFAYPARFRTPDRIWFLRRYPSATAGDIASEAGFVRSS